MDTEVIVSEKLPPSEFNDFLSWVDRIKDEIPEEYRGSARVDIYAESYDDGGAFTTCQVTYRRPETKEETKKREAEEERCKKRDLEYARIRYEELKKVFEPKT